MLPFKERISSDAVHHTQGHDGQEDQKVIFFKEYYGLRLGHSPLFKDIFSSV